MVQVKKTEIAEAITAAAHELFKTHGYAGTRMPQIAKAAGVSAANIYVYFDAKLDILIAVYQTWFNQKLEELRTRVLSCDSPSVALRILFRGMWQDLPAADNGFCGILIEALSDRSNQEKYSPQLRGVVETALLEMLQGCLPSAGQTRLRAIASMMVMAFDGYALNYHLRNGQTAPAEEIDALCDMVLAAQSKTAMSPSRMS